MENSVNCHGKVMEFYHPISVGTLQALFMGVGLIVCDVLFRVCVGIRVEPAETENWYCPRCKSKQKVDKKKKQRRKKSR